MKKILVTLFVACMLFAGVGQVGAADWVTANQSTLGWDAVTSDIDGDPIGSGFSVDYLVYIVAHNSSNFDADKIYVGRTSNLSQVITLTKGHWYGGVKAVLVDDMDGSDIAESTTISWSNDPTVCLNGVDFGYRYWVNPNKPMELRNVIP